MCVCVHVYMHTCVMCVCVCIVCACTFVHSYICVCYVPSDLPSEDQPTPQTEGERLVCQVPQHTGQPASVIGRVILSIDQILGELKKLSYSQVHCVLASAIHV